MPTNTPAQSSDPGAGRLLQQITCPNCWTQFLPEDLLFIAQHASLLGDDVAGPNAYRRFLPTRFTIDGQAIDARGMNCQQLACPRCHLEMPRALIEMTPLFVSVVGPPACGKSYYLASLAWRMRADAPAMGFSFSDGDPHANAELQRYEETLFLAANGDTPVEIRKTETAGEQLYQTVSLDGQALTFPRPFVFHLSPSPAWHRRRRFPHRTVVLYDNAGESFMPGADSALSPVTQHVSRSAATFFLFDPTQDPRFRKRCRGDDPQINLGARPDDSSPLVRQESVLTEMIARIRKHRGMGQADRHDRPLIILIAKADLWRHEVDVDLTQEPFVQGEAAVHLDEAKLRAASAACRKLMEETCPEIVAVADGFAERVAFLPMSALGASPELVERDGRRYYGVRPNRVHPQWVTAPLLWILNHHVPALQLTGAKNEDQPA